MLPLVSSAIINVAHIVDKPWPIQVFSHDGRAYNINFLDIAPVWIHYQCRWVASTNLRGSIDNRCNNNKNADDKNYANKKTISTIRKSTCLYLLSLLLVSMMVVGFFFVGWLAIFIKFIQKSGSFLHTRFCVIGSRIELITLNLFILCFFWKIGVSFNTLSC